MCGCQNHATEITFFDLVGLALIQSVSHLRVIFTVNMVYFSNDECLLFFSPHGLARAKYTQKANCIIIKIISYT